MVSKILGLEEDLLHKLYTLMIVLTTKIKTKVSELEKFNEDIMKSIIKYYPWFYCPNAVHKMLIQIT